MEESSLHASIKSLSIVSVHPVSHNEVTYSFVHRTFDAALHFTTLSQDEQLFYIPMHQYQGHLPPLFPRKTMQSIILAPPPFSRKTRQSIIFSNSYCNVSSESCFSSP